jgi:hypothetical protein
MASIPLKRKRATRLVKVVPIDLDTKQELDCFSMMIEYMYTADMSLEDTQLIALMEMADRYTVLPLREACAKALGTNISDDNLLSLLELANKFGVYELKTKICTYIVYLFNQLS